MNRYQVVCGPCHGDHRERRGPLLAGLGWSAPEIRHQIREGNALMPPIRPTRLSDDDIEALLAYFVTIGTVIEEDSAEDEAQFEEELERDLMAGETPEAPDAGVDAPADSADAPAGAIDAGAIDAATIDGGAPDSGAIDAADADG